MLGEEQAVFRSQKMIPLFIMLKSPAHLLLSGDTVIHFHLLRKALIQMSSIATFSFTMILQIEEVSVKSNATCFPMVENSAMSMTLMAE